MAEAVVQTDAFGFIISVGTKDGVYILVEATPYLGRLYTYVSVRHPDGCRPTMRVLAPAWVWRRVKRIVRKGGDIHKFILGVFTEYAVLNATSNYRIYYEEPHRLLQLF